MTDERERLGGRGGARTKYKRGKKAMLKRLTRTQKYPASHRVERSAKQQRSGARDHINHRVYPKHTRVYLYLKGKIPFDSRTNPQHIQKSISSAIYGVYAPVTLCSRGARHRQPTSFRNRGAVRGIWCPKYKTTLPTSSLNHRYNRSLRTGSPPRHISSRLLRASNLCPSVCRRMEKAIARTDCFISALSREELILI